MSQLRHSASFKTKEAAHSNQRRFSYTRSLKYHLVVMLGARIDVINKKLSDMLSDIQPSMMTHSRNLSSAFTHPKCTHTAVNTHPEQWAAIYAAAPGDQLGVQCLAQEHVHSLPHLKFLPARDSNPRPFNYKSNSLTIRPLYLLYLYLRIPAAATRQKKNYVRCG